MQLPKNPLVRKILLGLGAIAIIVSYMTFVYYKVQPDPRDLIKIESLRVPSQTTADEAGLKAKLEANPGEYFELVRIDAPEGTYLLLRSKDDKKTPDVYARAWSSATADNLRQEILNNPKFKDLRTDSALHPDEAEWRKAQAEARKEQMQAGGLGNFLLAIFSIPNLLMIAFIGVVIWQVRNMSKNGGPGSFGKSKHRKFEPMAGQITFKDVAGVDEAKADLEMVVEYLKDPSEIKNLGGKMPKGILMVGPPGTGKTLLARAVAGEAGVATYFINASEFVEMFVGVGAARVRNMFEEIRKHLPCILIIDELDAVAQHRGTGIGGGNDERQQTINQLLTEIDGFEATAGLIVFGLTNRPDVLDPAIVRSGRFGDMKIIVNLPDRQGRYEIICVHADGLKLDPSLDLMELAARMTGFSGADIASVLKTHAPRHCIKRTRRLFGRDRKAEIITMEDVDKGISAIQMGGEATEGKSKRLSETVKKLLAYHELGHALVGEYLYRHSTGWDNLWADPVKKVTIIGAGGAGGYTLMQGDEDLFCQTEQQLRGMITTALAANRAEMMFLKTTSTGAGNDIDRAYDIAKKMVTQLGMSKLGPICVGKSDGNPFLGRAMATSGGYGLGIESSNQIDHEIFLILADARLRAERILKALSDLMEKMVPEIIADDTMLRDKFAQIWDDFMRENKVPDVSLAVLGEEEIMQALELHGLGQIASPKSRGLGKLFFG